MYPYDNCQISMKLIPPFWRLRLNKSYSGANDGDDRREVVTHDYITFATLVHRIKIKKQLIHILVTVVDKKTCLIRLYVRQATER